MSAIKPEIGMGVTMGCGSDRSAATIVWVSPNGKKARVRYDHRRRVDGRGWFSEDQAWITLPASEGEEETITLRKDGRWLPKGIGLRTPGFTVTLGVRAPHTDPHR